MEEIKIVQTPIRIKKGPHNQATKEITTSFADYKFESEFKL